ncbi:MAG TPA: DUF4446 family protein [Candidatus Eremiobacteraceae bacterium]|nr:DUF4446 family protein [Candidatus Eremiobacteraceae bacterium]
MIDAWRVFASGLAAATTSPVFAVSAAFAVLAVLAYHVMVVRPLQARVRIAAQSKAAGDGPDTSALRAALGGLERAHARTLQNVGFVRFDAFPDVGSEQSYALAVVDDRGDGFLVSSIYSREEVRTYAKAVANFTADRELSAEERRALDIAKMQAQGPARRERR